MQSAASVTQPERPGIKSGALNRRWDIDWPRVLVILMLARIIGGEPCARDDLDALEWFPVSGPQPEMAFKADAHICERYYRTKLVGATVDLDYAVAEPRGTDRSVGQEVRGDEE